MSSYVTNPFWPLLTLACAAAVTLAACDRTAEQRGNAAEVQWARAALERNPQIELVATDAQSGVFTIRDRATGQVHVVRASELAAAPVAQLAAAQARAAATPAEPAAAPAPAQTAATPPAEVAEEPEERSATAAAAAPAGPREYTIEREGGRTRVTGPGISIVSTPAPPGESAQRGTAQRNVDPFICEGRRLIHFDNRRIYVDGDAVTARDGCELHITNSRIVASGTAVVAQDAVVHIANSYVEGAGGSFAAQGRTKMYVRDSTFQGLSRRDSLASIQDQGGNEWR